MYVISCTNIWPNFNLLIPRILYVCVFDLYPLLFPYRRGRTQTSSSACKTDQADFIDWMVLLPSNIMEDINPSRKLSPQIPRTFHQHGNAGKTMIYVKML